MWRWTTVFGVRCAMASLALITCIRVYIFVQTANIPDLGEVSKLYCYTILFVLCTWLELAHKTQLHRWILNNDPIVLQNMTHCIYVVKTQVLYFIVNYNSNFGDVVQTVTGTYAPQHGPNKHFIQGNYSSFKITRFMLSIESNNRHANLETPVQGVLWCAERETRILPMLFSVMQLLYFRPCYTALWKFLRPLKSLISSPCFPLQSPGIDFFCFSLQIIS